MARHDVEIYNEATGWVLTSKGMAGRDLSETYGGTPEWAAAVADGVFVPMELVQDDPVPVRVVVDEPLTTQEAEEWVGHCPAFLRIEDGVLILTGGSEYLEGEDMEEYTVEVPVPPGNYRLDLYTYMPWLNGEYCLKSAGDEPLGAYFRRTRPDEAFPDWLVSECFDEPAIDPGHEEEWDEANFEEADDENSYVMFLAHLTKLQENATADPPQLQEHGWIAIDTGCRRPERCPLGIRFTPAEQFDE